MEILGIILLLLLLTYLYLICPRVWKRPDDSAFYGVYYAHRGLFDNKTDAPENSLKAIKKAVAAGYGIEFDVQLSKDKIPVVFHDATLKRMCGIEGNVWDYTLTELRKFKLAQSKEIIPTLAEVLKAVDGKVPLIIEYKMDNLDLQSCEITNELLKKYNGTYCIESFHPLVVRWYKQNRPDVIRGQLSENYTKAGKKQWYFRAMKYLLSNFLTRPDFIAYRHSDANNISRRICGALGAISVAWTIRSQEQYEKAKSHFDLFIFDSFILK